MSNSLFRRDSVPKNLLLVNNKYVGTLVSADMPVIDPVCGIEMHQELAISHEHHGKIYYFCCEGCKRIFTKKPRKYSR